MTAIQAIPQDKDKDKDKDIGGMLNQTIRLEVEVEEDNSNRPITIRRNITSLISTINLTRNILLIVTLIIVIMLEMITSLEVVTTPTMTIMRFDNELSFF